MVFKKFNIEKLTKGDEKLSNAKDSLKDLSDEISQTEKENDAKEALAAKQAEEEKRMEDTREALEKELEDARQKLETVKKDHAPSDAEYIAALATVSAIEQDMTELLAQLERNRIARSVLEMKQDQRDPDVGKPPPEQELPKAA